MEFFASLFGRRKPAAANPAGAVEFDDVRVLFRCGNRVETILWGDLIEVGILTTDEGPVQEDVYFLLLGPTKVRGCAIPQGAAGSQRLIERLGCLPGFDYAAAIRAMRCTNNARFVCWRKEAPSQSPEPTSPCGRLGLS